LGERTCLSATEVGACTAEGVFRAAETCTGDTICALGGCRTPACAQALGTLSYLGCDYLVAELPNEVMTTGGPAPDAPAAVVVTNPDPVHPVRVDLRRASGRDAPVLAAVTVTVDPRFAGMIEPVTVHSEVRDAAGEVVLRDFASGGDLQVPPGGVATLLLPRATGLIEATGVSDDTWRLLSDRPVAAYQFNPYCCNYSFSNDASLLTPVTSLGREYRFLGPARWPTPANTAAEPTLTVLAAEDGTTVRLELPRADLVDHRLHPRLTAAGPAAVEVRLDAQEMLTLMPDAAAPATADLSGTVIRADRPVAVFSGHTCTYYPHDQAACDHLEEQLVPVDTWDARFVLVPPVRRGGADSEEGVFWKILARDAGTRVRLSRPMADLEPRAPGAAGVPDCATLLVDDTTLVFDDALHCEFGSAHPVGIEGDGPLMVLGIVSGQATTGAESGFGARAGDPSLFLVPPDTQYRQDYVFLAPATYAQDFVTVIAHPDATLTLDGAAVPLADATPVPGSDHVFRHVPITDGPHRISGDRPFGILVFAYDDFVSYAFTGGLNLGKR
ncbi:MAG: IgGFc-binding protein, partial [Myxococcales bacterium]|nr:IgGFc-binding protein [Myxococcales bacterium]